ncbi:type II toxin-antitoxin system VapC family toxin [Arthrobacter sp. IA7]|uniref:type II toxin-antitoxin system VapC family toxin n=1 Tax=Arthrobacter ipis TaxID=2716202 RepID=UPI001688EA12|nr:type II toxin-antitoxin system VapC family toxin [Arthrobacter ipis]MBD1541000.1 type II toxin-antitoxin system VapC family toxin [Arthrobacter ipis]
MTIVDTNVMVAALVDTDDDHERCAALVESLPRPIVLPVLTIAEICHFIDREIGPAAELKFLQLIRDGEILPYYRGADWTQICTVVEKYLGSKLGGVDASVLVSAEANGTNRVASMDNLLRNVVTDSTPYFMLVP